MSVTSVPSKFSLLGTKGRLSPWRRLGRQTRTGKLHWTYTPYSLIQRRKGQFQMVFTRTEWGGLGAQASRQGLDIKPKSALTGRDLMKNWMRRALAHEQNYHYLQRRLMKLKTLIALKGPVYADCSETTTAIAKVGGFKDPNGQGYNGTGYTGTLRQHGKRIHLSDAKVGDYIVHGPGTGSHVVTVYEEHPTDPLCFSHGQENGPRLYRHSVQKAAHGGYFTVHSLED